MSRLAARDRRILALAVPALGSLAVEPLYVLVDTAIVGRLGTTPLGGLALASTVLNTSFWILNFLAYGTTARVAFLHGRRDATGAARAGSQGLWLAAAASVVLVPVLALAGPALARGLGGSGEVLDAASTYLRISAIGFPFVLVALVGHGYLRGVHDTRTPLWIVLGANVLNVVLELWFVYGLDWGIAGSAWGTVVAQTLSGLCFVAIMARAVSVHKAGMRPDARELRILISSGRRLVVRTGALLATLAIATSVAARLGPRSLAAHQIAAQVWLFLALAIDALAIAGQALVGAALGAGKPADARDIGGRLLRMGAWAGVAFAVALAVPSGALARLFTDDAVVVALATDALRLVAVMQLPASAVFVLDGILMGASDVRFLQWAMLAALLAFVPIAAATLRYDLGITGLWMGLIVWMLARLALNGTRFAGPRWNAVTDSAASPAARP